MPDQDYNDTMTALCFVVVVIVLLGLVFIRLFGGAA